MPEVVVPQMVEAEKKTDESKVVRVLFAVPNEGHTVVEAYANRIIGSIHMGKFQQMSKSAFDFKKLIEKYAPEAVEAVMSEYWSKNQVYSTYLKDTQFQFFFVTLGRIFTPYAREEAAKLAIEHGMDYLFMVDDDMECMENLFERLWKHDVDIIAPLAFTRNFPHKPVIYATMEGWDGVRRVNYTRNHFVMNYPKDRLVECDAVGFGAVLIKTSVLKAMAKPLFMSTCGTGEDVFFCLKAREQGFRVFMDTAIKLGHYSHPQLITEEFVEKMRKDLNMEVEKKNGEYNKYPAVNQPLSALPALPDLVLGD